jgi:hypothetical protein
MPAIASGVGSQRIAQVVYQASGHGAALARGLALAFRHYGLDDIECSFHMESHIMDMATWQAQIG